MQHVRRVVVRAHDGPALEARRVARRRREPGRPQPPQRRARRLQADEVGLRARREGLLGGWGEGLEGGVGAGAEELGGRVSGWVGGFLVGALTRMSPRRGTVCVSRRICWTWASGMGWDEKGSMAMPFAAAKRA